jgi:hypothetical protein
VEVDFGAATALHYGPICSEDIDGNGEVDFADVSLLLLLLRFGPCD